MGKPCCGLSRASFPDVSLLLSLVCAEGQYFPHHHPRLVPIISFHHGASQFSGHSCNETMALNVPSSWPLIFSNKASAQSHAYTFRESAETYLESFIKSIASTRSSTALFPVETFWDRVLEADCAISYLREEHSIRDTSAQTIYWWIWWITRL